MPVPNPRLLFAYCCARLGIDPHDERGMTTTEVAVIVTDQRMPGRTGIELGHL